MLAHLFADIVNKGVTRNYNTKPNEQMHGSLKWSYLLRTNFKNIAAQVHSSHSMMHLSSDNEVFSQVRLL